MGKQKLERTKTSYFCLTGKYAWNGKLLNFFLFPAVKMIKTLTDYDYIRLEGEKSGSIILNNVFMTAELDQLAIKLYCKRQTKYLFSLYFTKMN